MTTETPEPQQAPEDTDPTQPGHSEDAPGQNKPEPKQAEPVRQGTSADEDDETAKG